MAQIEDADRFLGLMAPRLTSDVDLRTKMALAGLLDSYASAGYSEDDLAAVMTEQLSATSLAEASADEFSGAVTVLSADVGPDGGQHAESGEPPDETSDEELLAQLTTALAEDANTAISAGQDAFVSYVVAELWHDVKDAMSAEIAADPTRWPTKESAWEAAYAALNEAVAGFLEAGEKDGGLATLLSRTES